MKTRMQIINESFDSIDSNYEFKNPNTLFYNNEKFFTKEDIYELLNEARQLNNLEYSALEIFEELLEDE